MQSTTSMLANAFGEQPHDGDRQYCGLCGAHEPARPWKDVLKASNTSQAELKTPFVCWACEVCMNDRKARSNVLVTCDGVYSKPERKQIWPLLLSPPESPFLLYLTLSGKKHGIWRQHIATCRDAFRLQCEDRDAWFVRDDMRPVMRACKELLVAGVRRDSIETGRYGSTDFLKSGFRFIAELEPTIKPIRGTALWAILFGVMPGRDDIKEIKV